MSNGERELRQGNTVRLWLILEVNRWVLSGVVLWAAFLVLVGVSQLGLTPLRTIVANQESLEFVFSSFIGAIITGTSIVVTINQLVLSQELGAIGDQRSRMQESMGFRRDLEAELSEDVSPPEPAAFLWELVDGVEETATALADQMEDEQGDAHDAITDYVDDLTDNAQAVKDGLADAQFGTFEVLWYALGFNYSRKIYDARRLQADHEDDLSPAATEALEDTIQMLQFFGPAREHFKTLYFQWELIKLSRALLYIAVPALVVMGIMIMYVDAAALPGTTLGVDNLVWVTSAGFVIGIAPFVVFSAFIIRIASVAKRTLAMGPFILRESERDESLS